CSATLRKSGKTSVALIRNFATPGPTGHANLSAIPHAPEQHVAANKLMIERRPDVGEKQAEQQIRAQTMRNARRIKMEVRQGCASPVEDRRPHTAQHNHADPAGNHAEDHDIEQHMHGAGELAMVIASTWSWVT